MVPNLNENFRYLFQANILFYSLEDAAAQLLGIHQISSFAQKQRQGVMLTYSINKNYVLEFCRQFCGRLRGRTCR
jgi:hypothetical protein